MAIAFCSNFLILKAEIGTAWSQSLLYGAETSAIIIIIIIIFKPLENTTGVSKLVTKSIEWNDSVVQITFLRVMHYNYNYLGLYK